MWLAKCACPNAGVTDELMLLQGKNFTKHILRVESGAFSPFKLLVKLPLNDQK
jgi:hypothetical protein